ncbi:MAG: threonine synthase [Planctomycetaceae bacterium]|jgi:threonine synthase|nr:threonine synthase [Planctomycetaceae bacterium]
MSKNNGSLLTHLECVACGAEYSAEELQTVCRNEDCKSILSAQYDFTANTLTKEELQRRPATMWRYREFLPVYDSENIVTLGEGFTPIIPLNSFGKATGEATGKAIGEVTGEATGKRIGQPHVFYKDESLNPTCSFKARGLSAAVSKAKELGVRETVIPTAGNAGGALAAYSAKAGIKAHIYMPKQTPNAFKTEVLFFGAELREVNGNISDCGKLSNTEAAVHGWFDVSTLKEPYRLEGKKTMGYEIAEQFGWVLPDVILYPTGGGTGLIGIWKAFRELEQLGWIHGKRPRMVAVQSDSCNGIHLAFQNNESSSTFKDKGITIANGLRVPKPYADKVILKVLRESQGNSVSVNDSAILESLREIALREGSLWAPEGAALWHAFKILSQSGWIADNETVLLLNTGNAYKYLPFDS